MTKITLEDANAEWLHDSDSGREAFVEENPEVFTLIQQLESKFDAKTANAFLRHAAEVSDTFDSKTVNQASQLFLSDVGEMPDKGVGTNAAIRGNLSAKALERMFPAIKGRRYVDSPEEAPEGVEVNEGPQGGLWYEVEGDDGESDEGGVEWEPVPSEDDIDAFETFDGKEILVDGETYIGSYYLAVDGEVATEDGPNIPLHNIDGIRDTDEQTTDAGGDWDPVTDEMGFGDFEDTQILVDGEAYNATTFMPMDDEVMVEEGENFNGFPIEEIDGVRDAPATEGGDTPEEPEGDGEEFDPEEWDEPPENMGDLEDGQSVLVETDEGLQTATVNHADDVLTATFLDETGEPHDILDVDEIEGVQGEGNMERPSPEEADDPSEILETIPFYGDAERLEERVKESVQDNIQSVKDEDVAKKILDHIEQFESMPGRAHVSFSAGHDNKDRASLNVGSSGRERTINHEFGHMSMDAFDFGIGTFAAREAMTQYDSDEDNFIPLDANDTDYHLTYQGDGDPDPKMAALAEAVNKGWQRLQEGGAENTGQYNIKSNYSATNAHEFIAATHETLQRNYPPHENNRNWFYNHDELLPAYTQVFEPSNANKNLIAHLHENDSDASPFDENPYPGYLDETDKMWKGSEEVLEIRDYYRVWVKSPDEVPNEQNVEYDRSGGPADNHYYYEAPLETTTSIALEDEDVEKAVAKSMSEKARKEYPERVDLVDMSVPQKDLTLIDKARNQIENGMPLFGSELTKANPAILRDVESPLSLLHLYKMLYDEGDQYSGCLNQIQKELGARGIYSFERVSKARRYINSAEPEQTT